MTVAAAHHASPRFLDATLLAAGALAVLSAAVGFAGKPLGHAIALAGYSDSTLSRGIVVGGERIVVPENAIRHAHARKDGSAPRLDLFVRWPEMDGFSEAARDDFNNISGVPNILFIGFEPQAMSRDMSGRLEPIYRALVEEPGRPGPGATVSYRFKEGSGYSGETLVVAEGAAGGETEPFVARCLSEEASPGALAPCERDIAVGRGLSLSFRFPRALLAQWRDLDAAVRRFADRALR